MYYSKIYAINFLLKQYIQRNLANFTFYLLVCLARLILPLDDDFVHP